MKTSKKTNFNLLYFWIAENGGSEAKKRICKEARISLNTLYRILEGSPSKPDTRYLIHKLTGVKLCDEDDFPERQEAS